MCNGRVPLIMESWRADAGSFNDVYLINESIMSEEDKQLESQDTRTEVSQVAEVDVIQGESPEVEIPMNINPETAGADFEPSINVEDETAEVEGTDGVESLTDTVANSVDSVGNVQDMAEDLDVSTSSMGESVVTQVSAELEMLRAQLEERTNQYVRIVADFENFRKRTTKEKQDIEQRVKRNTIIELLPVVDSFERARSQIKPQTDQEDSIQKSYQSVFKQFVDCLKRIGVSPMRAKGTPFNPEHHEAVMREPTDEYEEGAVIEELVKGYMLGDQVLRHSMVKVATLPEPVLTSEDNGSEQPEKPATE